MTSCCGSPISTEQLGYRYDTAWNLWQRTNNGVVTTFTVNNLNQLTGNYSYDANGNMTSQGSYTYTWDSPREIEQPKYWIGFNVQTCGCLEAHQTAAISHGVKSNQLIQIQYPYWFKTELKYDARGRPRQRKEYSWYYGSWYPGETVNYVYDGMRVIQERRGYATVTHTRGIDLSGTLEGAGGIGGLLARTQSGTHVYYHADGNGNITCLINASQAVVASYRYDSYGKTLSQSGAYANANLYRFSSKEFHSNAGLYYYGYRWYEPNLQRWMNRDPIGEDGSINLYGFVVNSPINYIDFLGLKKDPACVTTCTQRLGECYSTANIMYAASGGRVGLATTVTGGIAGAGNLQTKSGKLRPFTCRGTVTSFWKRAGRGLGIGFLAGSIYGLASLHGTCLGDYAGCLDACPEEKKPKLPQTIPPDPANCIRNAPPSCVLF